MSTADLIVAGHEVVIEVVDYDAERQTFWSWWCRTCSAGDDRIASEDEAVADAEVHVTPSSHAYVWGGRPNPNCYACQGSGKVVGFGPSNAGRPCTCRFMCDNHERLCLPGEDE